MVLISIVCFYFFRKIFNSGLLSFLLILMFPFMGVVAFYPLVYITVFLLFDLQKSVSVKKFIILFFYSIFLLIWRLDVGYANLVAVLIYLAWISLWQPRKSNFMILLKSGAIMLLVSIILAGSIYFLSPVVFNNLNQALQYFGATQEHGLPVIMAEKDRFSLFHYIIIPILVFSSTILFAVRNKKYSFIEMAVIFTGLLYLLNFPRGLVRHGLIVGGDWAIASYSYLNIALAVIYYFPKFRFIVFCTVISILVITVKFPLENSHTSLFDKVTEVLKRNNETAYSSQKIPRVRGTDAFIRNNLGELETFMKVNLKPGETFIDFSNNPMLYFYLKQQVPSYFNQYLQNTITTKLQSTNLRHPAVQKAPLVVFEHIPLTWFDNTDEVPNPLRYQPITQFIYERYVPVCILNNRLIWGLKEREFVFPAAARNIPDSVFEARNYDLGHYPYILGDNPENEKFQYNYIPLKKDSLTFSIPVNKSFEEILCLKINITSKEINEVKITYSGEGSKGGTFSFTILPKSESDYIIPLFVQYNLYKIHRGNLKLNIPVNCSVNSVAFVNFQP
ncbi:MAG: hypothetical protein HC830_03600 [Bacteroidetes bacterium]|nr:hypothetical protein [Bacteroidota bacterium]